MSNYEQLKQAITVLETQRPLLGDGVVDTTVTVLQEKLTYLQGGPESPTAERGLGGAPRIAQRKQITILFASVSGFTRMAETLPDTNMLNLMNGLWQQLDGAITEQDGTIDKHMGDAVMGLFGVPVAHENDPERAIRAALTMRAALSDFIRELSQRDDLIGDGHAAQGGIAAQQQLIGNLQNLQLRIGINTGPVLLGEVGTGDEYTVIGDAVNVARRLEQMAPTGGILISHDTYLLVRGIFNVEALGPVSIKGKLDPVPVYMVLGVRPRRFYAPGRGVEGIETRMVGRDPEFQQLQSALQTAVQTRQGRVITIVGEAGVGKSRLIYEFNKWVTAGAGLSFLRKVSFLRQKDEAPGGANHQPPPSSGAGAEVAPLVFEGRADQRARKLPYALVRDLFATFFNIQDNDPWTVAEEKFVRGMSRFLGDNDDVSRRAHAISRLIGLGLAEAPILSDELRPSGIWSTADGLPVTGEAVVGPGGSPTSSTSGPPVPERVFEFVAEFFEAATAVSPVTILFLEDVHWADEGSFELVEYLTQICRRQPLLIICLARPVLAESRTTWLEETAEGPLPSHTVIVLDPLTEADSRQLVVDILRKVPEVPANLCDLIVNNAEGNPFYVEELIKILIEDGVIVTGQDTWQVQPKRLTRVRVPPTLTGVLQARLDRLSTLERVTLQRAAVVGRVFWDTAVMQMGESATGDRSASPAEIQIALQALEKRELIFRRRTTVFTGTQAYIFKHAILREVTYESVLLRQRPHYHKQVADWLVEQSGERLAEYAGLIAEHYELAGERLRAAELYELAATRAQEAFNPETAIDYYHKALALISDDWQHAVWLLRLQEQLGGLLQLQARLVEAAQIYMTMQYTAELDGDLAAQARAWNGLAMIRREQADYQAVYASAEQAEHFAWLVNAELAQVQALLYKAESCARLDNMTEAVAEAERALRLSEQLAAPREISASLSLLCLLHVTMGQANGVARYLAQLQELVASPETGDDKPDELACTKLTLGRLYNVLGEYDQAAFHLLAALKIYRNLDAQPAVSSTLHTLGETARLRGNATAALALYREALVVAEAIGNRYGELSCRTHMGGALVALQQYRAAENELRYVIRQAEDVARVVHWHGLPETYTFLAETYLGQARPAEALTAAQQAHALAQRLGEVRLVAATWCILGRVLARLPAYELPVAIDGRDYHAAADCFMMSLRLLQQEKGVRHYAQHERAQTLWHWAGYELARDNGELGNKLRAEALAIARRLKMKLPE